MTRGCGEWALLGLSATLGRLMMFVHYPVRRPMRRLPARRSHLAAWVTRWRVGGPATLTSRQPSHVSSMGAFKPHSRPRAHFFSARLLNLITAASVGLIMLLLLAYVLTGQPR